MIRDSRGSGFQSKFKYPFIVLLGFGLLFVSASASAQDATTPTKEEKAAHRAEKRKEIKHFFKKLNPFVKNKGEDPKATESAQTQAVPPPAPEPVPEPTTVKPDPGTTSSTKRKTTTSKPKKTSKPKTDKATQPLI